MRQHVPVTQTDAEPSHAAQPQTCGASAATNWGQEVKDCNSQSCYPDGASRGGYVRVQAEDSQYPGYGWEIHNLAYPGESVPSLR